ncbi:MAG: hypothetical protein ACR2H1_06285, partial [Limisphaerales bacterium]
MTKILKNSALISCLFIDLSASLAQNSLSSNQTNTLPSKPTNAVAPKNNPYRAAHELTKAQILAARARLGIGTNQNLSAEEKAAEEKKNVAYVESQQLEIPNKQEMLKNTAESLRNAVDAAQLNNVFEKVDSELVVQANMRKFSSKIVLFLNETAT